MTVLVTGATGLIGANIVRSLLRRGYAVRCLVRQTSRREHLHGLPVSFVVADLADPGVELDAACADCSIVFHTAAHFHYGGANRAALHAVAVAGTEALLRAASRQAVSQVVVTSSSVVFGYSLDGALIQERTALPRSADEPAYVAAKGAQHAAALRVAEQLGLDVRLACPTMTLGPTDASLGPSNGMIVAYLADPFASTYPGGCNLVSVRDVAAGHLLIAERGVPGESYLLGATNLSWRQVHAMIADLAGVTPPRMELGHTLAYLAATVAEIQATLSQRPALATREQAGMVGRYYWYSHAKAAALGYDPSPARDTLVETISWLAASRHITREVRAHMHLSREIHRFRSMTEAQH